VDLFSAAENLADDEDTAAAEEADEDGEPEDDFNAAWEVLDLARAIYAKQTEDGGDENVQLKLADTYIALGDVSLETGASSQTALLLFVHIFYYIEKFDQAITDYEAGLALKGDLLPRSSRQIAEAHYKLSIVLDLTSGRLGDAISHAQRALESIECRLAELANPPSEASEPTLDSKGKGKGKTRLVRDDLVGNMSTAQIEAETKELAGLKEDLAIKVRLPRLFLGLHS
jgi:HAT1-interacting factor 1